MMKDRQDWLMKMNGQGDERIHEENEDDEGCSQAKHPRRKTKAKSLIEMYGLQPSSKASAKPCQPCQHQH